MTMDGYTEVASDREFSWDDEIRSDGFTPLPPGDYPFEVTKFERARHSGSTNLPPCPMALLTIALHGPKYDVTVTKRLFLHTKMEGLLCAFFESIGQRKHGDPLKPRWNEVAGSRGLCRVSVREYTKTNGDPGESNDITRFLPPTAAAAAVAPAPASSWTQGSF